MKPSTIHTKLNWYILYTYPNYEKKVYKALNQKAIECFLPLYTVERQWSDRKKILEVPVFPNYIFVNTTSHKRFDVLTVPGIVRYVTFDNSPIVIPENKITAVKQFITSPGFTKEEKLETGDAVRITSGPFEGLEGVLIERKGKTRFAIQVEVINQAISIDLASSSMVKIENKMKPKEEMVLVN